MAQLPLEDLQDNCTTEKSGLKLDNICGSRRKVLRGPCHEIARKSKGYSSYYGVVADAYFADHSHVPAFYDYIRCQAFGSQQAIQDGFGSFIRLNGSGYKGNHTCYIF